MKRIMVFVLVGMIVASCGSGSREPLKGLKSAKGGINYGGTFLYNEEQNFKSLYPLAVTETV
ncbi:MAG: hypothetical protein IIA45_01160 [Bacteroidetes bacterium]|nr:hypothetical protein [Bacteroidota bacterium]